VPTRALKRPVAADIRAIFDAPHEAEVKRLIECFMRTYETEAPQLARWAETALPEGLAVLTLPRHHGRRLSTSSGQSRDHAANTEGHAVPERGQLPASGNGSRHGYLAGLADRAALSEYEGRRQRIERLRQHQDRVFTERVLLMRFGQKTT
jgi:transposase-like protein